MRKDWPQVKIHDVHVGNEDRQNIPVGESLKLQARVQLGAVIPGMFASKPITAKRKTAA